MTGFTKPQDNREVLVNVRMDQVTVPGDPPGGNRTTEFGGELRQMAGQNLREAGLGCRPVPLSAPHLSPG